MTHQDGAAPIVRCLNVKYSPNLGDGLLSECLEAALIRQGAAPVSASVDLAARTEFGDAFAGRGTVMKVLDALPGAVRQWAVRAPLALASRRKWAPHYAQGLADADAVFIGGGNLLSDHDLNFPTKLALGLREAGRRDLPVAIYACGMAKHWSAEGDRRMRQALQDAPPRAVFLRDAASCARWDERFGDVSGCKAVVVRDPGLLAQDTYGAESRVEGPPRIGLGIMSHVAIRYHSHARLTETGLLAWYRDLAARLQEAGAEVVAFTNGAPEDRAAADALAPDLERLGISIQNPTVPSDLSSITGGCNAIVAYRMHAVIAAYAHAVPAIALTWDDKLDAFMDSVNRSDWLADPSTLDVETAAAKLLQAALDGVDMDDHARVVNEARNGVRQALVALQV